MAIAKHLSDSAPVVRVRVLLLTPALFGAGWRPAADGPLLGGVDGLRARLVAAIVPRPETVSGWDLEQRRPKPTRRLVPSGSVFWVDLEGSPERRRLWLEKIWMNNVSDEEQDRLDGYGLAAVGVAG